MEQLKTQLDEEAKMDTSNLLMALEADYLREKRTDPNAYQAKLNYAVALIKSSTPSARSSGLQLVKEIAAQHGLGDREVKYLLALGYYQTGELDLASEACESLLRGEPTSSQANALYGLICRARTDRERQVQNMAIAGGGLALAVGVAAALAFALTRK